VAIAKVFSYVEDNAAASISWYARRKLGKARASRCLRALAIVLAVVGGLIPIIYGIYTQAWIAQLGYALLALAAGAVAADRYFGVSLVGSGMLWRCWQYSEHWLISLGLEFPSAYE